MDVELTSIRDDGTWGWRAVGARQPKGVVDASLLYEGAKVGDVVRAEAEFELDGISVSAVYPPKHKRAEPDRLEVVGPRRDPTGVTTTPAGRRERPRPPGRSGNGSSERRRRDGEGRPGRRPKTERVVSADDHRPPATPAVNHDQDKGRAEEQSKPRRLNPGNAHRRELLSSLLPEQVPVAEQLIRGGLPAVRQAVAEQNQRARRERAPEVKPDALVAMAEELLPKVKAAVWRDRAEAAAGAVDQIGLRDLRSVVVGADAVARDEQGRLLAARLREAFEARLSKLRDEWSDAVVRSLDEGRVVRALHLSARPPEPAARMPAELAMRLRDAAGAAMAPEAPGDRWSALLEAVVASPVRRVVKPAGLPERSSPELLEAVRRASGQVPALAPLVGIEIPPPPGPPKARRGVTPPRRGAPSRSARPPKPTQASKAPAPRAGRESGDSPESSPSVGAGPTS